MLLGYDTQMEDPLGVINPFGVREGFPGQEGRWGALLVRVYEDTRKRMHEALKGLPGSNDNYLDLMW